MIQTDIKFKTMERKTRLTDGKVCYQGQLMHNHVLNARRISRSELATITPLPW